METETEGIDYDRVLNDNIVWVEEEVTEIETVEDSFIEDETEIKVLGTRYDAIDLLTGKEIIPTISVPSIDFQHPDIYDYVNSTNYTVQNDGFAYGGGYVYANNVGIDYSTATYTMFFDGYAYVRLYCEVNSEGSCDYLSIQRNGYDEGYFSGENRSGWIEFSVYAGDTVTLLYHKDGSYSVDNEYCHVTIDVTGNSHNVAIPHGATVEAYNYFFVVTKAIYSAVEQVIEGVFSDEPATETIYSVTVEKTAYTYNGVQIAKATWKATYDNDQYTYISEDGTSYSDSWKLEEYDEYRNPEYAYVTYDGNIYLINKETNELIPGGSALTFIDRPAFDYANDAYGYVVDDYTLYVYDLSKWLECVYTYTIPSYFVNADTFLLENGSLLLQTYMALPDNAVSYDVRIYGAKYDLVYILIDPAAKTATEVEFGYWIDECITEYDIFTDKATNVFVVYPIAQSMLDYSAETILIVGNDLSVLCQLPDLNYESLALFGNGYIRMYNDLLDCYEILDSGFNFVTYVPQNAYFYETFFEINNKLYTVADGKIQALDTVLEANLKGEYELYNSCGQNLIVREIVEIPAEEEGLSPKTNFYLVSVDATGFKLTKIGKEANSGYEELYSVTSFGYITMVFIYDQDPLAEGDIDREKSFLNIYNEKGEKIGTTQNSDVNLDNFQYSNSYENDGVYTLTICYRDTEYGYQYLTYVIQ